MAERWIERFATGLTFLVLAGFVVLNYGFNNWPLHVMGVSLPVGHVLILLAFGAVAWGRWGRLKELRREPVLWAWLGLLGLSLGHLVFDLPRYGMWAIRDSSFVVEIGSLILGFFWATDGLRQVRFQKILFWVFLLNLAYSLSYPFRETLAAVSPVGGIFRPVPLLGAYCGTSFFLLVGALFYLVLASYSRGFRRWVLLGLALAQAGWAFLFQSRSHYLGMLLAVVVVLVFLGWRKAVALSGFFALSFASFLVLISLLANVGAPLRGRIGPVTPDFYWRHLSSIWLAFSPSATAEEAPPPTEVGGVALPTAVGGGASPTAVGGATPTAPVEETPPPATAEKDVPALGSARWRLEVWKEALGHWLATPRTVVVGEGFGRPLINFHITGGVAVRQPHNTHLTFLARLGLVGFALWGWMQMRFLQLFWLVWRKRHLLLGGIGSGLFVWFLLFYLNGMLLTTVEPWLEFSYGAIPFFTIMGFGLGWARLRGVGGGETKPAVA